MSCLTMNSFLIWCLELLKGSGLEKEKNVDFTPPAKSIKKKTMYDPPKTLSKVVPPSEKRKARPDSSTDDEDDDDDDDDEEVKNTRRGVEL